MLLVRDDAVFTLSPTQGETFAGWKRPKELFDGSDTAAKETSSVDVDPESTFFSARVETCDLVQDVTTDCSVVAGLSAAINILIGKRSVSTRKGIKASIPITGNSYRYCLPSSIRLTTSGAAPDILPPEGTSCDSTSMGASGKSLWMTGFLHH